VFQFLLYINLSNDKRSDSRIAGARARVIGFDRMVMGGRRAVNSMSHKSLPFPYPLDPSQGPLCREAETSGDGAR
jgi:hypothetical protein